VSQATICESYGGTAVVRAVVYVPCADGVRAVRIDKSGQLHVLWHVRSSSVSGSPIVGGGRVWSLDPDAGVLHALDPRTGLSREQVQVGATSRFAAPAAYGSDVVVPTMTGITVVGVG
jgi:outer membrane protein assembly factor BamB